MKTPTTFLALDSPLPRIAMVSTHGYVSAVPPLGAADTGGQVVYVLELSKRLASLGYEVDIWTRRFESQPEIEPVAERVRIIRAPCGGRAFLRKEYLCDHLHEWTAHADAFIRANGLTYQFFNSHYWDAGFATEPLARALGTTHVHTPHSVGIWKRRQMEADYPQSRMDFERVYNFERRVREELALYAAADLIVATTPAQEELLAEDYGVPAAKLRLAPPGCDETRFFPVDEAERLRIRTRLGFTGKVVLALGRLARNKGYDLLIAGFARVAAADPDAQLHLAVGGTEMNPVERTLLADLRRQAVGTGFADRIRFGSFVPDKDLADYYRAADLFVLSSRYEPFGMTAIEAMASGTPTVVTVHGGLCRALAAGTHALFADPLDPCELGVAISTALRQTRLRSRLSQMGAAISRSLFSWGEIARRLVEFAEGGLARAGLREAGAAEPGEAIVAD
ncbi:MAG: glycosyltransferase [Opitutaceae bacterium]